MPTYDKDGHLFGDAYFNADYFHVGNESSEKTYINMENEELEIHNLAEPTEDNDAATKKYVDDNAGGGGGDGSRLIWINTAGGTAETVGTAIKEVYDAGNVPGLIRQDGSLFGLEIYDDTGGVYAMFLHREIETQSNIITSCQLQSWTFIYEAEGDAGVWTMENAVGNVLLGQGQ